MWMPCSNAPSKFIFSPRAPLRQGGACWELVRLERGIHIDSQMPSDKTIVRGTREHVAHAVFVDRGPMGVDGVCTGTCRQLCLREQPISGKVDVTINFRARALHHRQRDR